MGSVPLSIGGISPAARAKAGLIHECKGRAEWSKIPGCIMEFPNWRELMGKKETHKKAE